MYNKFNLKNIKKIRQFYKLFIRAKLFNYCKILNLTLLCILTVNAEGPPNICG